MAYEILKCPSCGGECTINTESNTAVCNFCGSTIFIKDTIIQNFITNNITADAGNPVKNPQNDFIVNGGRLIRYAGKAKEVTVPNGLTIVGGFSGLAVTKVTIPEGVVEISEGAFSNCGYLDEIVLPKTLKVIGKSAFANSKIGKLELPENLESIGLDAFYGSVINCLIFNAKNIKAGTERWKNECNKDTVISKLIIGEKVSVIPDYFFTFLYYKDGYNSDVATKGCAKINTVEFKSNYAEKMDQLSCSEFIVSNNVTSIADMLFRDADIDLLSLPSNGLKMGKHAFWKYWRKKKVCIYCGGELKHIFIWKKCTQCKKGQ